MVTVLLMIWVLVATAIFVQASNDPDLGSCMFASPRNILLSLIYTLAWPLIILIGGGLVIGEYVLNKIRGL